MAPKSRSTFFILAILVVSALSVSLGTPTATASTPTHRLGFWLQDSNPFPPATTFFNAMFLTPPYPSALEVMIFAPFQDQLNNYNPTSSNSYTMKSIAYWGQVAKLADAYPNIRLIFDVAFNSASSIYGLSDYRTIVTALAKYPSVYGLGVEGEYTKESTSIMSTAMSYVTALGKSFVNYYAAKGMVPSGGYDIAHTNFPGGDGSYDQVGTLSNYDSQTIGLDSGYYANFRFPSSASCPLGGSSITSNTAGWNQCIVGTEINSVVAFSPSSARQFLEIDAGFSSSGSFTGVSGQKTNQLWDNPTLRNWIWTDTSYKANFILSTTSTPSPAAPSSSSSSTSTTTTTASKTTTTAVAVTTATTSLQPISTGPYSLSTFVACPSGVAQCGSASPIGVGIYNGGTKVTLDANPYGGFMFSSWSICSSSSCQTFTTSSLTFAMTANTRATANFVRSLV